MLNIARIDDEQESLDIAKGAFSTFCESFHQEVHIKGFTRGDVFLDSLKDNLYDLVCSDIIRQPRDGIELAEKLRKIDKEVPLIFISSNETNVFFLLQLQSNWIHPEDELLPGYKEHQETFF